MKQSAGVTSVLQSTRHRDSNSEVRQSNIATPDTSHMLPFRPSAISGGAFMHAYVKCIHILYVVVGNMDCDLGTPSTDSQLLSAYHYILGC